MGQRRTHLHRSLLRRKNEWLGDGLGSGGSCLREGTERGWTKSVYKCSKRLWW
ncbi:hypothetical protein CsatB_016212 [Cannabis sativa]